MQVPSRLKRIVPRLKFLIKAAATVLLLAYLAHTLDADRLRKAVMGQDPFWLGVGMLVSATFVATRIAKWRLLAVHNGLNARLSAIVRLMLFSLVLGIVTPGRVGETASVAAFNSADRPRALLLYIYDRVGELCLVLLFGIPGCLVFFGWMGAAAAVLFFLCVVFGISFVQSRRVRILLSTVLFLNRIGKVRDVLAADLGVPPSYWILSCVAYIQAYLLITAFILGSQPVSDWRMVLLLPIVTLSNIVSVTVGGLGIREGLAATVLPHGSIAPETAAAAFFLSFFFTRVAAGAFGLVWTVVFNLKNTGTLEITGGDPNP